MITVKVNAAGSKQLNTKLRRVQVSAKKQQRRAIYRGVRAGRTLAAKELRAESGIPSKVIKSRLIDIGKGTQGLTGLHALRAPIPVEQLGARALKGKRSRGQIKVRRWPTDGGFVTRLFPGWEHKGKFRSRYKSDRPYRLKGRSIARVWVGLLPDVQARAREVYERTMSTWLRSRTGG